MWFSPHKDEYFCVKCYATGWLPVVEGDAYCPRCDEWVWTVKPVVHSETIVPDYRLPIKVSGLPLRLRGRRFARLCVFFFRPLVRRWLNWKEERFSLEFEKKTKQLWKCKSRKEFERVLGRPVRTLTGEGIGGARGADGAIGNSPDLIEYYHSGCCTIGLHFKDDKIQQFEGSMKFTALSIEFSDPPRIQWDDLAEK